MRVLIGEDAPELRELLALRLGQAADVEVVDAVADGASVVAAAARHRPDAVLVDLSMPGGLAAAELLRELRRTLPEVAIVVYSGTDPAALDDESARQVIDAYLPKATDIGVVRARLCELALRRRRARRA